MSSFNHFIFCFDHFRSSNCSVMSRNHRPRTWLKIIGLYVCGWGVGLWKIGRSDVLGPISVTRGKTLVKTILWGVALADSV